MPFTLDPTDLAINSGLSTPLYSDTLTWTAATHADSATTAITYLMYDNRGHSYPEFTLSGLSLVLYQHNISGEIILTLVAKCGNEFSEAKTITYIPHYPASSAMSIYVALLKQTVIAAVLASRNEYAHAVMSISLADIKAGFKFTKASTGEDTYSIVSATLTGSGKAFSLNPASKATVTRGSATGLSLETDYVRLLAKHILGSSDMVTEFSNLPSVLDDFETLVETARAANAALLANENSSVLCGNIVRSMRAKDPVRFETTALLATGLHEVPFIVGDSIMFELTINNNAYTRTNVPHTNYYIKYVVV